MGEKRSRLALPPKEYKRLLLTVIFPRDRWRCKACGSRLNLHAHHILFRSHGGGDYSWNLLTLCDPCHHDLHVPNPRTGATFIIIAPTGNIDDEVNADNGVRICPINGWTPKRKVKS